MSKVQGTIVAMDFRDQAITIRSAQGAFITFTGRLREILDMNGKALFSAWCEGAKVSATFNPSTRELVTLEVTN